MAVQQSKQLRIWSWRKKTGLEGDLRLCLHREKVIRFYGREWGGWKGYTPLGMGESILRAWQRVEQPVNKTQGPWVNGEVQEDLEAQCQMLYRNQGTRGQKKSHCIQTFEDLKESVDVKRQYNLTAYRRYHIDRAKGYTVVERTWALEAGKLGFESLTPHGWELGQMTSLNFSSPLCKVVIMISNARRGCEY